MVAPEYNQSGAGHSLSLTHPVRARQLSETKFALEGTPTDCVLFAVKHLLKDRKPDIVLSGVNRGANMADDVTYSGTIAGAMEGCLLGIPSIAFSQAYAHPHPVKWDTATPVRRRRGAPGAGDGHGRATSWSTSTSPTSSRPTVKGVRVTRQGVRGFGGHIVERTDPRGGTYYWIAYAPGEHEHDDESDLTAVRSGYVSVTPLHLDLTHEATRRKLAAQFAARLSPTERDRP